MDSFFSTLVNLLPAAWRPWVVLGCVVIYLVTKIRSHQKTWALDSVNRKLAQAAAVKSLRDRSYSESGVVSLGQSQSEFEVKKQSFLGLLVEILF